MSCKNCDNSPKAYFRYKKADIELRACEEHFKEIVTVLSAVQSFPDYVEKLNVLNEIENAKDIFGSEFAEWLFGNLSQVYSFWARAKKSLENNEKIKTQ